MTRTKWEPFFGAVVRDHQVHFAVWAPLLSSIEVVGESQEVELTLQKRSDGVWAGHCAKFQVGDLYRYRINQDRILPDPASRFQPFGVHGPSQVIDPAQFSWTDHDWKGPALKDAIIYELHPGTFTHAGTFAAAAERLPYLRDLGITCVELMPVADFPGRRNWGYDGVDLFAPARCYGTPDALRTFVNTAHELGLAVLLDVVYNHFGPDGAYAPSFSPYYFTDRHKTPWGDAINLDGEHSTFVRKFFIENALYWIHEFHMDGLRLDATHALIDESPKHFLAELTEAIRVSNARRNVMLIAEDHRNMADLIRDPVLGGYGLDAVWSDDFHHEMRSLLTGDREGYFVDFAGECTDVAAILRNGWLFSGRYSEYFGGPRGTDPNGLAPEQFVFFLQNHDQIGNRAMGDRLNHQIDPNAYRAASTLLLCAAQTPLLFMGQEWSASTPFCYFTDHHEELGKQVTEGRRREFARFSAFSDPAARAKIPDPQKQETFELSRLNWSERTTFPHAGTFKLYQQLIHFRKTEFGFREPTGFVIRCTGDALIVERTSSTSTIFVIVLLKGAGEVPLPEHCRNGSVILTTEDPDFVADPKPPEIDLDRRLLIRFCRAGAVLLRSPTLRATQQ